MSVVKFKYEKPKKEETTIYAKIIQKNVTIYHGTNQEQKKRKQPRKEEPQRGKQQRKKLAKRKINDKFLQ